MRRLIWGFAGRTYHIVGNLMHWLSVIFSCCCQLPINRAFLIGSFIYCLWFISEIMLYFFTYHFYLNWAMGSWWAFEILCCPSSIIINQLPSVCQSLVIFKDLLIHFVKFHKTSQELSLKITSFKGVYRLGSMHNSSSHDNQKKKKLKHLLVKNYWSNLVWFGLNGPKFSLFQAC